jgi:hypothetical protein
MNNKKIFIIIAVVLALFLAGLFYFMLTYDFKEDKINRRSAPSKQQNEFGQDDNTNRISVNNTDNKGDGESRTVTHEEEKESIKINDKDNFTENNLKNLASSFSERFGSYSNHSNYGNFDDLEIFMTDNMKEWAKEFVDEEKEKEAPNDYYGITTKAIATNVKEFDKEKGTAEVVVSTKRKESEGQRSNSKTYDQKLTLEFIDQNGIWKVNKASWEK